MKLKVLHIITRLDSGGSAYNTLETVARSNQEQFSSVLLSGKTNDVNGEVKQFINKNGVVCEFMDELRREVNPFLDFIAFFKLYNRIRQGRYDVVHTHTSKAGILGRWAAFFAGCKCIVHTPHGHIFHGYFNKFLTGIFIALERLAAKITKKIITLTDRGIEDHVALKIAPRDKFVTIYSGIDIDLYKMQLGSSDHKRDELKINRDAYVFGTCGRLEPIKGHQYLIEAMPEVIKKYPQAYLLIVGDGDMREDLHNRVEKLGIQSQVTFTGFQADVPSYIQAMDCFCLASLNEGMGRSILEAMACAKPVIASNIGGIPELVEEDYNGYLFPPEDTQSLSKAMLSVICETEKAKRLGVNGQNKAGEKFSVEKMVEDINHLYLEILK